MGSEKYPFKVSASACSVSYFLHLCCHPGHEIGKKFRLPMSKFVSNIWQSKNIFNWLNIFPFIWPSKYFLLASSPFWPTILHLSCCYFVPCLRMTVSINSSIIILYTYMYIHVRCHVKLYCSVDLILRKYFQY